MTEIINFYHYGSKEKLDTSFDHWMYIGRPSPKFGLSGSPLANPYRMKNSTDRDRVIKQYKEWLWGNLLEPSVLRSLLEIRRYTRLVCWCAPKPCHGDAVVSCLGWLNSFVETEILLYQFFTKLAITNEEHKDAHLERSKLYYSEILEKVKTMR